jgi:endonuclease YncB( thermonuclease family)
MAEIRPFVAMPKGKIRVYDGDTFYAETLDCGWGVSVNKPKFRIARIDTPEKGWRAKTDKERALSLKATAFLKNALAVSHEVLVYSDSGLRWHQHRRRAHRSRVRSPLRWRQEVGCTLVALGSRASDNPELLTELSPLRH